MFQKKNRKYIKFFFSQQKLPYECPNRLHLFKIECKRNEKMWQNHFYMFYLEKHQQHLARSALYYESVRKDDIH